MGTFCITESDVSGASGSLRGNLAANLPEDAGSSWGNGSVIVGGSGSFAGALSQRQSGEGADSLRYFSRSASGMVLSVWIMPLRSQVCKLASIPH